MHRRRRGRAQVLPGDEGPKIKGIPVEISRTGYTGDLGYEIWVEAEKATALWDALMEAGRPFDITPTGMLALDVARIEAGLILLDVDYTSSKKALIPSQKYSPFEIGLGRLVNLEKAPYIGQAALRREAKEGPPRQLVGLDVSWDDIERLYDEAGLAPQLPATASRVSVPVYQDGAQVGKATSTTWSPTLKRLIALATVSSEAAAPGHEARDGDHRRPPAEASGRDRRPPPVLRPTAQARLTARDASHLLLGRRRAGAGGSSSPPKKRSCISFESSSAEMAPSGRNHL